MQIPYGIHQKQPCEDNLQNRYSEKKNFARVSLPIKLQVLSLQKSSIAGVFL